MSKISEFADASIAFFDRVDVAVSGIGTAVDGVAGDVAWLKEQIKMLPSQPSPEDQARLDAVLLRFGGMATNVEDLAAKTKALDEMTPPAVPVV